MLEPLLVLLVDVLQVSFLVLFNTLCDIGSLLLAHELLVIVTNGFPHAIHDFLDATTSLGHVLLASLLLFQSNTHVKFNLLLVFALDSIQISHSLLFIDQVILDNLHCSLSLTHLFSRLRVLFLKDFSSQLINSLLFLVLVPHFIVQIFLLRLQEHVVSHFFLLHDFHLQVNFLLSLKIELFTGLINDSLVKIFAFLLGLLSKISSHLDLLVENFAHLLLSLFMLSLLVLDLFQVQALAKFLHFAPFVVADIRWHVIHLHSFHTVGQLAKGILLLVLMDEKVFIT